MTVTTSTKRPAVATRRTGYLAAVVANLVLLGLVNVWPGWEAVPFLTAETAQVLGFVNASMAVGVGANLVYLFRDPVWLRSLGEVATTVVGIVALVQIWMVFPFDFGDTSVDWTIVVRVLLVVAVLGSVIGVVTRLVAFAKDTASRR